MGDQIPHIATPMAVRRLTPEECEKLQGFPSGWTRIPWRGKPASECPDGARYKCIGNSMTTNVMRWIGMRIQMVDALVATLPKQD
jgi:DNA (cytosine-5)-methyltransferase 1